MPDKPATRTTPAEIRLAHSPDSDDMVMWWPLTGQRSPGGEPVPGPLGQAAIDTGRFRFTLAAADVEDLNQRATKGDEGVDVTAISAASYPGCRDRWVITRTGGSFGEGYGPRVVVRSDSSIASAEQLAGCTIAVPGLGTTAFLTLSLLLGSSEHAPAFEPVPMRFDAVQQAVLGGDADAGLLIHEAQLTHEDAGLRKVVDLGAWWGMETGQPLPLGLNVARADLDERFGAGTLVALSGVLHASVRHALDNPSDSRAYLRLHQGDRTEWSDTDLVDRYLSMYVSELTLDMGEIGIAALQSLYHRGAEAGLIERPPSVMVV